MANNKIETLEELYVNGLSYLYDAEQQLTEALPKMAEAASTPQLKQAFEQHLKETKEHVQRAEKLFQAAGKQPERKPNNVVQAMRDEVEKMVQMTAPSPIRDAALIVAGNQVEHYEISAYGSLQNYAQLLGRSQCVQNLKLTLEEEKKADALLTQIGESQVNNQTINPSANQAAAR